MNRYQQMALNAERAERAAKEGPTRYPYFFVLIQLLALAGCVLLFGSEAATLIAIVYIVVMLPFAGIAASNLVLICQKQEERLVALEARIQELDESRG